MRVARTVRRAAATALTFALLGPAGAQAASPGLVGAYGFEETAGTAATDSSGAGNGGTIAGATRTSAGRFGAALSFDGINDRVNVPDAGSLDLTSAMTLEAWVRPTGTGWRTAVMKERPGGVAYGMYASTDTNRPSGEITTSTGVQTRGTAALASNTWSHVATTFDGASLRLYVNGTQVATKAASGSITVSTGALRIGGNAIWNEYFKGLIDEVRVYSRALPAAEVQADMNAPVVAPPDITPPSVTITRGCTTLAIHDYIDVWATVTDDRPGVVSELQIDGARVGSTVPGSIVGEWESKTVANGAHVLGVVARDAAGNTTTKSCDITVHNPTVTADFASPADGATVSGVVTLQLDPRADGEPLNGFPMTWLAVTISGGGVADGAANSKTRTWDTTALPDGVYTIKLDVGWMDYSAPRATKTIQVTVANTVADTTPPTVTLAASCDGRVLSEYVGPISGSATDDGGGPVTVEVKVDDTRIYGPVSVSGGGAYQFNWDTRRFSDGAHTMTVLARDEAGNQRVLGCPWSVNNRALTVPIVVPPSPVDGTVTIRFQPKADGVNVTTPVQLRIDGVLVASPTSGPYEYSWDTTTVAAGPHTIEARMFWLPFYSSPQATATETVTVEHVAR